MKGLARPRRTRQPLRFALTSRDTGRASAEPRRRRRNV